MRELKFTVVGEALDDPWRTSAETLFKRVIEVMLDGPGIPSRVLHICPLGYSRYLMVTEDSLNHYIISGERLKFTKRFKIESYNSRINEMYLEVTRTMRQRKWWGALVEREETLFIHEDLIHFFEFKYESQIYTCGEGL